MLLSSLEGSHWTYGSRITYSFMPDGTNIGGVPSSLFRTLEAAYPSSPNPDAAWELQFQKAAAVWQAVANINLAQVSDNGEAFGSPGNQQDDPNVGDIRIGALSGGWLGSGTLAESMLPPPINSGTNAGDIFINADQPWGGSGFDLETVALHEIGHALGMGHSQVQAAVMYAYYNGTNQTLNTDDVSGIQSIYGAIPADPTSDGTWTQATDITPYINGNGQIALSSLNIVNVYDYDYYKVTVPSNTTGTMVVTIQSSNLSSLSPRLNVYRSNGTSLGQSFAANSYGATVSYTVNNVEPGQVYYLRATVANYGPSSNGAYGLLVNFGSQAQAPIAPPNTVVASQPDQGGGSSALSADPNDPLQLVQLGSDQAYGDLLTIGDVAGHSAPRKGFPHGNQPQLHFAKTDVCRRCGFLLEFQMKADFTTSQPDPQWGNMVRSRPGLSEKPGVAVSELTRFLQSAEPQHQQHHHHA
jgi:hypothetical protein